jgi:hypothetical protein
MSHERGKCGKKSDLRMRWHARKKRRRKLFVSFRISPVGLNISLDTNCGQHNPKNAKLAHLRNEKDES